jgi:hypothetical protein
MEVGTGITALQALFFALQRVCLSFQLRTIYKVFRQWEEVSLKQFWWWPNLVQRRERRIFCAWLGFFVLVRA